MRIAAAFACAFLLFAMAGCLVREIQVTGNYLETDEEITELLGSGPLSKSSVFLYLFNRNRKIGGNTFVDTLTVNMNDLHSVTVNVREKDLIGCVEYDGKYWYFNRSGLVLVSKDSTAESDQADDSGTSIGEVLAEIKNVSELAPAAGNLSPAAIVLTGDSVIYGEEYDNSPEDPEEEDYEGEELVGTAGEAGTGEEDGNADDVTEDEFAEDEFTEDADEDFDETEYEEETYSEEEEPESGEAAEEEAENAEDIEDDPENPDGIIQPEIVTDASQISGGTDPDTQQTWEIDTSAKGGNYIPVIKGLVFSEAALGYPLPVQFDRVFSSIAVLKSFVDRTGYVPDTVSYDADGDLFVTYGQAEINLGKGEHIEQRVMLIGEALPSFAGLSGTLHLENYDGTQNRLIFSKK